MGIYIDIFFVLFFTILSGFADSQGFFHGSKIWEKGKVIWPQVAASGMGYILGSVLFWFAIKYLQKIGVFSSEVQTLFWFCATITGVAVASGKFFHWHTVDQIVAILIIFGLGWLMFRVG